MAARGLDVPDVTTIMQYVSFFHPLRFSKLCIFCPFYVNNTSSNNTASPNPRYDAPQDPDFFVHRVGRTARNGAAGQALLFLLKKEAKSYIDLLHCRKVHLVEISSLRDKAQLGFNDPKDLQPGSSPSSDNTTENRMNGLISATDCVRDLALSDRAIMEKAQACFVSYIRAYKEHTCQFVFRLKDLPFADLATGLGLLFFPKLPDLKRYHIQFTEPRNVRPSQITFKDAHREKQRQINSVIRRAKSQAEQKEREDRVKQKAKEEAKKAPRRSKVRNREEMLEEFDELEKEHRLLKKLKRGAITQAQFSKAMGEDLDSDLDMDATTVEASTALTPSDMKTDHQELVDSSEDIDDLLPVHLRKSKPKVRVSIGQRKVTGSKKNKKRTKKC